MAGLVDQPRVTLNRRRLARNRRQCTTLYIYVRRCAGARRVAPPASAGLQLTASGTSPPSLTPAGVSVHGVEVGYTLFRARCTQGLLLHRRLHVDGSGYIVAISGAVGVGPEVSHAP